MSHECTTCGRTFPDGSKEMLSGCPDCGGNKFQFHPGGKSESPAESNDTTSPGSASPTPDGSSPPETAPTPASDASSFDFGGVRSDGSSAPGPEPTGTDSAGADPEPTGSGSGSTEPVSAREDRAQASARSTFVSDDELPRSDPELNAPTRSTVPGEHGDVDTRDAGGETGTSHRETDHREPGTEDDRDTGPADDRDTRSEGSEPTDVSALRAELNEQFESIKIHAPGEYELNLMELYDREEHIVALQEDGRYVIDVPGSWRDPDQDD